MELILQRFSDNRDSTLGLMFKKITDVRTWPFFMGYTLEDEQRDVKKQGETRINAGFYELGIQTVDTPLTLKYRAKYPWFESHIEIKNVKNFVGAYIHIGNTDQDSAACVLMGDSADNNRITEGMISSSTNCFKRFYQEVYPVLKAGKKVTIDIRDEIKLL